MYSFEKFRMTYHEEVKQFPLHFIGAFVGNEIVGWGAVKMTGEQCQLVGIKHALLVTTGLSGTGIVEEVQAICKHAGIETTIFKVGQSNPRVEDVENGLKAFQDAGADGFLSVGGGSSHDTAKLIRVRLENPDLACNDMALKLDPYYIEVVGKIKPCVVPQVAVNTTAGTGAEMTGFGVVTDWEAHWKYPVVAVNIIPFTGIVDPALLRTMPERLAAQTGMDCFIHGMGGFVSRLQNEHARATGLRAAKLCWENLPEFIYNRLNDKACEAMAWAQYLGALTYALGGGVGLIHAHAHQISAINDLHHGLTNAIMMVPVVKRNYPAAPSDYAELARDCFGIDTSNMDRLQAAEACVERIEYFRNIVGITDEDCKLGTYGITEEDCKHISKLTINDLCYEGSARDMTEDESFEFLKSLI